MTVAHPIAIAAAAVVPLLAQAVAPSTPLPPWLGPALGGVALTVIGWSFSRNIKQLDRDQERGEKEREADREQIKALARDLQATSSRLALVDVELQHVREDLERLRKAA